MFNSNHKLLTIDSQEICSCTIHNCQPILSLICEELNAKLSRYCEVTGVSHNTEIAMSATITHADVSINNVEYPKNTLKKSDEPIKLQAFSYEDLKKKSNLYRGKYRGKLYGTVEDHICNLQMDCPECNGTGICRNCSGKKQVTCNVCDGSKSCPDCDGTGRYTCPKCGGEGWIVCEDCDNGVYYEDCRDCDGTGWYRENVPCRTCGGSGKFEKTCRTCDGNGGWDCDYCDDDYCVECRACKGSGECGKCKGKGSIWCPSCQGKGKCFDCKGDKVVGCTRCQGSGVYQSVDEYTFDEQTSECNYCSIIGFDDIELVFGNTIFDGIIYDFFAKKKNIDNVSKAIEITPFNHKELVTSWINNVKSSFNMTNGLSNDYYSMNVKLTTFPSTKFTLVCQSKEYNIWVLGEHNRIIYKELPTLKDKFFGTINKFLQKKRK